MPALVCYLMKPLTSCPNPKKALLNLEPWTGAILMSTFKLKIDPSALDPLRRVTTQLCYVQDIGLGYVGFRVSRHMPRHQSWLAWDSGFRVRLQGSRFLPLELAVGVHRGYSTHESFKIFVRSRSLSIPRGSRPPRPPPPPPPPNKGIRLPGIQNPKPKTLNPKPKTLTPKP